MAEVFGVFTGAISVGSLAIQIFDSIQKLHDFCTSVQDAPRDLFLILEELEMLGSILVELERGSEARGVRTEKSGYSQLRDPLDYCCRAAQELHSLVSELNYFPKNTKIQRKWAAVKAVLKKDRVEGIQKRLESAKSMLNLAISCASLKLQMDVRNTTSVLERAAIQAGNVVSTANMPPEKSPSSHLPKGLTRTTKSYPSNDQDSLELAHIKQYWIGIGWYVNRHLISRSKHSSKGGISKRKHNFRIEQKIERLFLPLNFLGIKGFNICSNLSWGNWQYSFKAIRIVPDTSPIFELCSSDSIERVLEEVESGAATLFDTTSRGHTLLHVAAAHARSDLCLWLIQQGVPSDSLMLPRFATPLHLLAIVAGFTHSAGVWAAPPLRVQGNLVDRPEDVYTTMRILVEYGNSDPMSTMSMGRNVLHVFSGPPEALTYLLERQEKFQVDTKELMENGSDVLEHQVVSMTVYPTELIQVLFEKEPVSENLATRHLHMPMGPHTKAILGPSLSSGWTLLHAVLWRLLYQYSRITPEDTESMKNGFRLVSDLINAGADIHAQSHTGTTPLDEILDFDQVTTKAYVQDAKATTMVLREMSFVTKSFPIKRYERERPPLLLLWLDLIRRKGFSLHEYARKEQELHPDGILVPSYNFRIGIQRIFEVEYIPGGDDIIICIKDVAIEFEKNYDVPGSWVSEDIELDYLGRDILRNMSPSANWKINTATDLPPLS